MNTSFKNFRVVYLIMFIFLASVSFSGCAWVPFWGDEDEDVELESEFDEFEEEKFEETDELKADIQTLQSQQEESQLRLEELEDTISSLSPRVSGETSNSADIEELKDTIHKLQSQIEDLKDNVYEMEFDRKLRSSQRARVASRGVSKGGGAVKRSYDKALQLFNSKQYDESLRVFNSLDNRRTPANLRDNVVFWAGQCYYRMEDYDRAIENFDIVINEYRRGNKVIDSLYGMGISYNALGEKSRALSYLEKALNNGPSPGLQRKIERKIGEIEG